MVKDKVNEYEMKNKIWYYMYKLLNYLIEITFIIGIYLIITLLAISVVISMFI